MSVRMKNVGHGNGKRLADMGGLKIDLRLHKLMLEAGYLLLLWSNNLRRTTHGLWFGSFQGSCHQLHLDHMEAALIDSQFFARLRNRHLAAENTQDYLQSILGILRAGQMVHYLRTQRWSSLCHVPNLLA